MGSWHRRLLVDTGHWLGLAIISSENNHPKNSVTFCRSQQSELLWLPPTTQKIPLASSDRVHGFEASRSIRIAIDDDTFFSRRRYQCSRLPFPATIYAHRLVLVTLPPRRRQQGTPETHCLYLFNIKLTQTKPSPLSPRKITYEGKLGIVYFLLQHIIYTKFISPTRK